MKKNEHTPSLGFLCFYSIIFIILGIRVAMTSVLEGPLLVLYLIVVFFGIYTIVGSAIKIYRDHHKKNR